MAGLCQKHKYRLDFLKLTCLLSVIPFPQARPMAAVSDLPGALAPVHLLYDDLGRELATTRRFLQRYPGGQGAWRPHPRSRTLSELASHVADIPGRLLAILQTDGIDIAQRRPPAAFDTADQLVAHFDGHVTAITPLLAGTDFGALEQGWSMRRAGAVLFTRPRRALVRDMVISHLIHHRAQLGVYYRMLDVPVPGSYGPSADEA